jgi:pimeloyl-ACP methyl ester carboxylesterase
VIVSERDFWSRPEDRELLLAHLVHAPTKRLVVIPDATHFVHLDRNEHGRQRFLEELMRFCQFSEP